MSQTIHFINIRQVVHNLRLLLSSANTVEGVFTCLALPSCFRGRGNQPFHRRCFWIMQRSVTTDEPQSDLCPL